MFVYITTIDQRKSILHITKHVKNRFKILAVPEKSSAK